MAIYCRKFVGLSYMIVVYLYSNNLLFIMEETIIPYELPDIENHSFFFVDIKIDSKVEAKLHQHDAWELYYVLQGYGNRMAGDTLQPFSAGDVVLIPPSMAHCWEFASCSADNNGHIHYLMVAFGHSFVMRCMEMFPELRNRLANIIFPVDALKFGTVSSRIIGKILTQINEMNELERLCEMFRLLPIIFTSTDYTPAGKPIRIERDVRRMQQICTYVMSYYNRTITLDEIASEVRMNKSAFCSYFKRCKGVTFSQFVTEYRMNTACELLKQSQKQVAEICFLVGFNDLPHFNRVFKRHIGKTPTEYRNTK